MLEIGMKAPEFALLNQEGMEIKSSDFLGKKLTIFFYPRANTAGCTRQAAAFGEEFEALKAKGIAVLGMSRDSVKAQKKFHEKLGLPYDLLSDTELSTLEAFGVWQEKKLYSKVSMGIVRSSVLLDEEGKVLQYLAKVKPDGNAQCVLDYASE